MQQIRAMSFGEILDGAFKIYRSHFMPMFLSALILYAPFMVLGAVFAAVLGAGAEESTAGVAAMGLTAIITFPLMVLGFAVSWGSVTHLASEAYLGRPVTLKAGLSRGLKRALPLFGALIMAGILMFLGFLFFIIPGFIVMAMFFAVFPAVVVESRGPVEALGRSRELARGSLGRILGIVLVAGLIAALPNYAVTMFSVASTVASGGEQSAGAAIGTQGLSLLLSALAAPFSTTVAVLLYYDRRIRSEGLDVQMMAEGIPAFG